MGRGGRIVLDRFSTDQDDFWRTLDFSIVEPTKNDSKAVVKTDDDSKFYGGFDSDFYDASVKSEQSFGGGGGGGGDSSSVVNNDRTSFSGDVVVKKELAETDEALLVGAATEEEREDVVEVLRAIRRDW